MKRILLSFVALISIGSFQSLAQNKKPLNVVATVGMIADIAKNVGGDCVAVTSIMGAGIDPHLYKASARDVQTFSKADIILYSGFKLEGQLGDVLARFGERIPTVAVSVESLDEASLISVEAFHGTDPHIWMDVSQWAKLAPTVAKHLSELRPDCTEAFSTNSAAYVAQLNALHTWITETLKTIPEEQRLMVTAHDAFSYYGRAYSIEVKGIQGISTESEAGIADIRNIAKLVGERKIPAIFIESTINPRTIQAVVDAVKQEGHDVKVGESLFSDAMGNDGTLSGTYIGMLYTNTKHITQALGGTLLALPVELAAWASQWEVSN